MTTYGFGVFEDPTISERVRGVLMTRTNRIDSTEDSGERRKFERHQSDDVAPHMNTSVWTSMDRCVSGCLVDQSDGGIGLWVDEAEHFQIGFQVRVQVSGAKRRTASIVYVEAVEPEGYRLGLAWDEL